MTSSSRTRRRVRSFERQRPDPIAHVLRERSVHSVLHRVRHDHEPACAGVGEGHRPGCLAIVLMARAERSSRSGLGRRSAVLARAFAELLTPGTPASPGISLPPDVSLGVQRACRRGRCAARPRRGVSPVPARRTTRRSWKSFFNINGGGFASGSKRPARLAPRRGNDARGRCRHAGTGPCGLCRRARPDLGVARAVRKNSGETCVAAMSEMAIPRGVCRGTDHEKTHASRTSAATSPNRSRRGRSLR